MRGSVEFAFRGRMHRIADARTRMTLLDWIRTEQRAVGTKEGCAEGDCGACTVVLARLDGDRVEHQAVNACILLVGQVHGSAVLTVEDLARRDGTLHPVQDAMIKNHAAQCGFCTPGIVMSLFALHHQQADQITRDALIDHLAGNLCRCTGYRPIVAAGLEAAAQPAQIPDGFIDLLRSCAQNNTEDIFAGDDSAFFAAPASETRLQELLALHPGALMIAGSTDVGLTITKHLKQPMQIIWLGRVQGLDAAVADGEQLALGATATLTRASRLLDTIAPDVGEVLRRFGSVQVRNSGTVGGNIANGSPIGDLAPCLIALGATLELASAAGTRTLPLEDYFLSYGRQDRRSGEYVRRVLVPKPGPRRFVKAFKVSKRLDEDISAVLGAFGIDIDGRQVTGARIAFGGMAGIPARALNAEQALVGASLDTPESWEAGIAALASDYVPLDDHRASAGYRRLVAGNLLRKALMELSGIPGMITRLTRPRATDHAF